MQLPEPQPSLFSLMSRLTAEERQKLGERRRAFRAQGAEERLVPSDGGWTLEYRIGTRKVGAVRLEGPNGSRTPAS